jgi:hypothetical protein
MIESPTSAQALTACAQFVEWFQTTLTRTLLLPLRDLAAPRVVAAFLRVKIVDQASPARIIETVSSGIAMDLEPRNEYILDPGADLLAGLLVSEFLRQMGDSLAPPLLHAARL